jgi:hypothetical protein
MKTLLGIGNSLTRQTPKSFYIETPDSNYYFTYFFTHQMLILTGKYAHKPVASSAGR